MPPSQATQRLSATSLYLNFSHFPNPLGAIHLGETFSSIVCINNDAPEVEALDVSMKVEMQTATAKVLLADIGGTGNALRGSQITETVVHHEIKELGQHVLACAISYRIPPSMRNALASPEDSSDPTLRSFRKYYKFVVSISPTYQIPSLIRDDSR